MQVEIQVRTELEDTWAQIVERLADQWGRGIRYGEDPVDPEAQIRAGQQGFTRRQAVTYLIDLGTAIDRFELLRGTVMILREAGQLLARLTEYAEQSPAAQDPRTISELPEDGRVSASILVAGLNLVSPGAGGGAADHDPASTTMANIFGLMGASLTSLAQENTAMLDQLLSQEQELRDTLEVIASASAEGE